MTSGALSARVCVTGGLGFIGRHLCTALAERGYDVVCVDRSPLASAGGSLPPEIDVVRADVSVAPLEPLVGGADAVVHLAALPGVRSAHPPRELERHNVHAAARVARALRPGQRLVLASTSSVYGDAAHLPTSEDCPTAPLNPYATTKLAAERAVLRATDDAVVGRLFTVFGPGQRRDMAFARWIDAIPSGRPVPWCARQTARRDFTYVDDAVAGLIAALERGRPGEIYNLGAGRSVAVRDALATIEDLLGQKARLAPGPAFSEAAATEACTAKAQHELGHSAQVSLRDGLMRQLQAALLAEPAAA